MALSHRNRLMRLLLATAEDAKTGKKKRREATDQIAAIMRDEKNLKLNGTARAKAKLAELRLRRAAAMQARLDKKKRDKEARLKEMEDKLKPPPRPVVEGPNALGV